MCSAFYWAFTGVAKALALEREKNYRNETNVADGWFVGFSASDEGGFSFRVRLLLPPAPPHKLKSLNFNRI